MKKTIILAICFKLALLQEIVVAQNSECEFCGEFGGSNGFIWVNVKIKADCTFEYQEFADAGGLRHPTYGSWRSSSDTLFLTTNSQPEIEWIEESVEHSDSISICFFDKDTTNISDYIAAYGLAIEINGVRQDYKESLLWSRGNKHLLPSTNGWIFTLHPITPIRSLGKIRIILDRVPIEYEFKNSSANLLRIGLNPNVDNRFYYDVNNNLVKRPGRWFKNEPFLFWKDRIVMRQGANFGFDFDRPLLRK